METQERLSPDEASKDEFFRRIADIGQEMIGKHGEDFATGAFVLAARWIAEGKMQAKTPPN